MNRRVLPALALAFPFLAVLAGPLAAQSPATEAPAPDTDAPAASRAGRARDRAPDDGRKLGILQRRPGENLHRHVSAGEPARSARRSNSTRPAQSCFPFVSEVVGWTLADNDFLRLLDAQGQSVLEFSEVEGGIYEAPKPGEGILFIQNPAGLGPAPKTAEQMSGEWNMVNRTGKPICALTLSNSAVGEEFAVRVNAALRCRRPALCARDLADGSRRDRAALAIRTALALRGGRGFEVAAHP